MQSSRQLAGFRLAIQASQLSRQRRPNQPGELRNEQRAASSDDHLLNTLGALEMLEMLIWGPFGQRARLARPARGRVGRCHERYL